MDKVAVGLHTMQPDKFDKWYPRLMEFVTAEKRGVEAPATRINGRLLQDRKYAEAVMSYTASASH